MKRVLALAALLAHGAAAAADVDAPPSSTLVERFAETAAEIAAMPEAELKKFYLRCSRAAVRGRIGSGEIQLCSIGYERLLQHSFGGDFGAFLDWRRDAVRRREPERPDVS